MSGKGRDAAYFARAASSAVNRTRKLEKSLERLVKTKLRTNFIPKKSRFVRDLGETSEVILASIKGKKNQGSNTSIKEPPYMFTDVGQMFTGQVQFKYMLFDGKLSV